MRSDICMRDDCLSGEAVSNALNLLDDRLISDVLEIRLRKRRKAFAVPVAAAAAVVLLIGGAATAAVQNGYFQNVKRWDGAVVGTQYQQAGGEIQVSADVAGDELTLHAVFLKPDDFPYRAIDEFGLGSYQIADISGKTIIESDEAFFTEIIAGQAEWAIPLEKLDKGTYKLIITSFQGAAKADQPLEISGYWECEFVY